jgi:hypothetical protein
VTAAAQGLRRLLVVLAALVLVGHGGVELAPRLTAAGASVVTAAGGTPTAGRTAATRPAAESQPTQTGLQLRVGLAAAVPSGSADPAAGPGELSTLAPHLRTAPVVRPPSEPAPSGVEEGTSGRGPPVAAGT